VKNGNPVSDINAGLLAALGVVAAYANRLRTGRGQIVDTSLFEAALQQTYWHAASYFATGHSPAPLGSAHLLDRALPGVRSARRLSEHRRRQPGQLGAHRRRARHPEWRSDPRFATNTARMENLRALVDAMNAVLRTRTRAEWMSISTPPAFRPDRSTRSARRSSTPRRWRAAWSSA
jgi:crotonobetainyl-CoA:carnitine CoA-transferase CaiB-like acyl-CoA transferase